MAHKPHTKDQETPSALDPVQQGTSVAISARHAELSCPNAHGGEERSSGHAVSPLPRSSCGEQLTAGPGEDAGSGGGGWMTACVVCACVCPRCFPEDGDLSLCSRSPTHAGCQQQQRELRAAAPRVPSRGGGTSGCRSAPLAPGQTLPFPRLGGRSALPSHPGAPPETPPVYPHRERTG